MSVKKTILLVIVCVVSLAAIVAIAFTVYIFAMSVALIGGIFDFVAQTGGAPTYSTPVESPSEFVHNLRPLTPDDIPHDTVPTGGMTSYGEPVTEHAYIWAENDWAIDEWKISFAAFMNNIGSKEKADAASVDFPFKSVKLKADADNVVFYHISYGKGGKLRDTDEIAVAFQKSPDGGRTWNEPFTMLESSGSLYNFSIYGHYMIIKESDPGIYEYRVIATINGVKVANTFTAEVSE